MKQIVLLETGTVGEVELAEEIKEGSQVTVILRDENGNKISEAGFVKEVLNTKQDWE